MATGSPKRSALLLVLLAFFILAIILFVVVLISYLQHPYARPRPTSIPLLPTLTPTSSLTPTATSTITLTPRPTWTPRPSETITQTPTPTRTTTPTLIRTITPAKPARYNDRYELKPWDLAQQERTIELLKANTVLTPSSESFRTLAYAEGEALLRFPDTVEAVNWRWDRAYNLLRIRDPLAINLYIALVKSAISSGQVRSSDLPTWFGLYETRLTLQVSPLPAQPGELGRELIAISGEGSAYLWLVEIPLDTDVYPLINDFDFDQPHENAYLYADLTADDSPELVIYRVSTPGLTQLLTPHIFALTDVPPRELPLQEQIPVDFGLESRTKVETIRGPSDRNYLRVTNVVMPSCHTSVVQEYAWNGDIFTITPLKYELVPVEGQSAYCEIVLDEASTGWGPEVATSIATPLLDIWPPEQDTRGHPYPPDALDQLRYRLGVLYALADQSQEATRLMSEIIDTPAVSDSSWVAPAQQFLRLFQKPEDLYVACQQAQFCNLRDALRTMVRYSATDDPSQVLSYLQRHGVILRSSSLFDFDQDGQAERWMIIVPKAETKLEFWILSKMGNEIQPVFVQLFEAGESYPSYHEPAGTIPIVQFELHNGFIFKRLAETGAAYIQWVEVEYARPTIILDGYNQALIALMDGANPVEVRNTLLDLLNSPRFMGDCIAFRICDRFHYTLALAYNLTGEDSHAIDEYLWVWRNYGQSPYSTLARLKLDYFPLPTYTQTPPPSRTPTPTGTLPTSTITPTRTPTSTSEAYP